MIIPQLLSWAHYRSMQQSGKSISRMGFCNCDRDHLVDIRYKMAKIKYRYLSVFWCYFCDVVYAMFIRLGILKYRFQVCRGFHAAPALLHSCTPALLHSCTRWWQGVMVAAKGLCTVSCSDGGLSLGFPCGAR
ncbi:hypothetical protein [Aeromonas caviae]|uniref:hypothetical protein n=1 Tax=Aeromonas caviae TaxID=648 RepID=UPI002B47DDDC|nr:hypothetical protein [Aeromonas caviae]